MFGTLNENCNDNHAKYLKILSEEISIRPNKLSKTAPSPVTRGNWDHGC